MISGNCAGLFYIKKEMPEVQSHENLQDQMSDGQQGMFVPDTQAATQQPAINFAPGQTPGAGR